MKSKAGFIVFGTHKDGLKDPSGDPFIDNTVIENSKKSLLSRDILLSEWETVLASKEEAREAFSAMKKDDAIDALVLFSGTWIWAGNIIAAVRDFAMTGKPVIIWTHPGSQGWRPVGGFVMHAALLEVGIPHKFIYAAADEKEEIDEIAYYCRAGRLKNSLNQSTIGVFGGRGMGQTCGVADPSQWMRVFGVDIDSRDTTELITTANAISGEEIAAVIPRIEKAFGAKPPDDSSSRRSIALYLALKKLIAKYNFDFYTIQSFPGLGDDYGAACFAQSLILDDGIPTSTLSDFNSALSMYLLMKLSGTPGYYGDIQHVDKNTKEIKIICDGACPPSLADKRDPPSFAGHGIPTEGAAGGLSVKLTCKPGPAVLARLGRTNGEFVMVLAKGTIFVPDDLEKRKRECGIPFWPHAFMKIEGDINRLLSHYSSEYCVICYGDELYGSVKAFCDITGIKLIEV